MKYDFSILEELKVTTFLSLIVAEIPVLGFLPSLDFLCLTENVPNDDIFTSSPFSSSLKINSKISSIILEDSDNDKGETAELSDWEKRLEALDSKPKKEVDKVPTEQKPAKKKGFFGRKKK